MAKVVMVADDLTGANANCSLMKKIGLTACSLLNSFNEIPRDMDVVAYTTNSRAIEPEEAYKRVREGLKKLKDDEVILYSKRIDSTLRGNLGSELRAFLDELEDYIGICVPAYPDSGRIVVNGTMIVNGSLLMNTDAGKDSKTPVFSNDVEALLSKNLENQVKSIYLEDVEKGAEYIAELIKSEKKKGTKLIIFDGVSNRHLEEIAKAVVISEEKSFAVDAGPFTKVLTQKILENEGKDNKLLMVVGSVTDITIKQINETIFDHNVKVVEVDPLKFVEEINLENYMTELVKKSDAQLFETEVLMITTTPYRDGQSRLDLKEISKRLNISIDDISIRISTGLAKLASKILKLEHNFSGVFCTGGDITVALSEESGAIGIEIREEVLPLVAYGRIMGGDFPQLRIISKGGMVGDKFAMSKCINKLKNI